FDTGERRHDRELPLALEYVDRRLPVRRRCACEPGPEELPMQLLRPLDHRAGFGSHPVSRIGCGHCNCLLNLDHVLDIRPHSSKSPPGGGVPRRGARGRGGAGRRPAARKPAGRAVCARKRKRVTAGGRSDTERAPPCLGTIFISPTGEKAWTIPKEWTCRATPRRVRRRGGLRADSNNVNAKPGGSGG